MNAFVWMWIFTYVCMCVCVCMWECMYVCITKKNKKKSKCELILISSHPAPCHQPLSLTPSPLNLLHVPLSSSIYTLEEEGRKEKRKKERGREGESTGTSPLSLSSALTSQSPASDAPAVAGGVQTASCSLGPKPTHRSKTHQTPR